MSLLNRGEAKLHSGLTSSFKIDADALSQDDIYTAAWMLAKVVGPYGPVVGIPTGGLRLEAAMKRWVVPGFPVLIVDDVLTTGGSMESMRDHYPDAKGAVIFARGPCPDWIEPLLVLHRGLWHV